MCVPNSYARLCEGMSQRRPARFKWGKRQPGVVLAHTLHCAMTMLEVWSTCLSQVTPHTWRGSTLLVSRSTTRIRVVTKQQVLDK